MESTTLIAGVMSEPVITANALFDVLGNPTRRKILELLAEEPKYLLQLSKELSVSLPAVQKHLEILEKNNLITSYQKESELAAPPRKYYQLKSSLYLSVGITGHFMKIGFTPIEERVTKELPDDISKIREEIEELKQKQDLRERLKESHRILAQLDEIMRKFDDIKLSLLSLRQEVQQIASQIIKQIGSTILERRVLYTILGSKMPPNSDSISAKLEVRERTIEEVLKELDQKGVLPFKRKVEK
ncbi:MAG: ArsR family transcriptional regulator [archaeon]|nr:ArsR family transcriptional regulator [archaeon]